MYQIFQIPTKWAPASVGAWCGKNKLSTGRRWPTEDNAFEEICERVRALTEITKLEPDFSDSERRKDHCVVRAFGVTWNVVKVTK